MWLIFILLIGGSLGISSLTLLRENCTPDSDIDVGGFLGEWGIDDISGVMGN